MLLYGSLSVCRHFFCMTNVLTVADCPKIFHTSICFIFLSSLLLLLLLLLLSRHSIRGDFGFASSAISDAFLEAGGAKRRAILGEQKGGVSCEVLAS